MILAFFDFGFSEMLLVGVVALLVFGGNLPEVMRNLGRSYAKLRASLRQFTDPVRDELRRATFTPPPAEGILSVDDTSPGEETPASPPHNVEAGEETAQEDVEAQKGSGSQGAETTTPHDEEIDEPPPV